MSLKNYECELRVNADSDAVFAALTSEIDRWWTTSASDASQVGTVATFRFGPTYNKMRVTALAEGSSVEWKCVDQNHIDDNMTRSDEWVGTKLSWKLAPSSDGTLIHFKHAGLTSALECYDICENGWNYFILDSLKSYLESGEGKPFVHCE